MWKGVVHIRFEQAYTTSHGDTRNLASQAGIQNVAEERGRGFDG